MPQKTVLVVIASKFQSKVWRLALTSQNISVIGGPSDAQVPMILDELRTAQMSLPDLVIIDFDLDNPYDICRWCRLYYPNLKIVLISTNQKSISSIERRWAIHQGADDLIAGIQQQNLLSNVTSRVSRVLEILDCPPLQEIALMPVLLNFCQEIITPSPEAELSLEQKQYSYSSGQIVATKKVGLPAVERNKNYQSSSARANFGLPSSIKFLLIAIILIFSLLIVRRIQFSTESQQNTSTARLSQKIDANTFQQVNGVPSGIFNYDGSTTWVPILKLVNPQIHQAYPQLKLRYSHPIGDPPGSSTGIKRLLEGQIDFAVSSRPLKPQEYERAKQQGFSLSQHQIAIDGIVVAVNHSLPVDGISTESLKQIYLGELTNWSQLGGPNLEIVPISRSPKASGTVDFFQDTVLNREKFGSMVDYQYSTTEAIRLINSIPNGIYYGSASAMIPQCTVKPLLIGFTENNLVSPYKEELVLPRQCPQQRNQINQQAFTDGDYPITRNLFVIVKHNGEREEVIGEAYVKLLLSQQGQELVKQAGFVPIE